MKKSGWFWYPAIWVLGFAVQIFLGPSPFAFLIGVVMGFIAGLWSALNICIWVTIRNHEKADPDDYPFNWRVLVGPDRYFDWLVKQQ